MPTYLIHGFRWSRASIRYHVVVYNVDDAAQDWIVAARSRRALLRSFAEQYDFVPGRERWRGGGGAEVSGGGGGGDGDGRREEEEREREAEREGEAGDGDGDEDGLREQASSPRTTNDSEQLRRVPSKDKAATRGKDKPTRRPWRFSGKKNSPPTPRSNEPCTSSTNTPSNCIITSRPSDATLRSRSDRDARPRPATLAHFNACSPVKLLEPYDVHDLETIRQPHAFVGDYIVEVKGALDMREVQAAYDTWRLGEREKIGDADAKMEGLSPERKGQATTTTTTTEFSQEGVSEAKVSDPTSTSTPSEPDKPWIEKLRDAVAHEGGDAGWFVVVCDDEERAFPTSLMEKDEDEDEGEKEEQEEEEEEEEGEEAMEDYDEDSKVKHRAGLADGDAARSSAGNGGTARWKSWLGRSSTGKDT